MVTICYKVVGLFYPDGKVCTLKRGEVFQQVCTEYRSGTNDWIVSFVLNTPEGSCKCYIWTRRKELRTFAHLNGVANFLAKAGITNFSVSQGEKIVS